MRRIVDENIDAAQLRYGLRDHCSALARVLDVARQQDSFSTGFRHQPLGLPGVLVLVKIGDQNVSALPGIRDGNGSADSAVATGDDGFLAGEAAAALVGVFAV